jgi:hypothetical protein
MREAETEEKSPPEWSLNIVKVLAVSKTVLESLWPQISG